MYSCDSAMPCPDRVETQLASDKIESVLTSFVENAIALHSTLFDLPGHHYGGLSPSEGLGPRHYASERTFSLDDTWG